MVKIPVQPVPPAASRLLVLGDCVDIPATYCGRCGFDTVLHFPISVVSPSGVTGGGELAVCAHCYQEAIRHARGDER